MKRATERQRFLLAFVAGGVMTVSGLGGAWRTPRISYGLPTGERDPSQPEGKTLIDNGWVTLERKSTGYTEDTKTGQRWYDQRAVITEAGLKAMRGIE